MMKKLMWKCQELGYKPPLANVMKTVFNSSDLPAEDPRSVQPNNLLRLFLAMLRAVLQTGGVLARTHPADKMQNMKWNISQLPSIIEHMRNRSEDSVCFMRAFVAALSWEALTTPKENITDMDDYEKLVLATKPALQDISSGRMRLPKHLSLLKVARMMMLLKEMNKVLPESRKGNVVKWLKQQMAQNNFSCTTEPKSDSESMLPRCNSSMSWLSADAATMLGPYLFNLRPDDVESSKEQLCEFFRTQSFPRAVRMRSMMKPSLAKRFLQKCFSGEDFEQRVEKLGSLACYYETDSELAPELSRKLLSQLDECDNPQSKKLKRRLVRSMVSKHNLTQIARDLGSSISLLPLENVRAISWSDLMEIQQNASVQWTPAQMHALVKKRLGDERCKQVTSEEVMDLKSLARGLPSCVLKKVKAMRTLMEKRELRNITKRMRRGQLKAVLQGLAKDVKPLELVQKLDDDLLCSMSLNYLTKVNITSLDQVNNKTWCPAQALHLARKMKNQGRLHFRKLRSVLRGVTCRMYEEVSDEDVPDMVQAIEENPQWLSKGQARCAAEALLRYLEKQRPDYFETITDEELDEIPTVLLINQPPWKLRDLPDAVCSTFLNKMENANLNCLPPLSPSRPALVQRALLCLGDNFSKMTSKDVAKLGPLLCELQPSQLRLMARDVLISSLMAVASCEYIPPEHSADLVKLVSQTFGDPSGWSPELMEDLGPLLLLDDDYTAALPSNPSVKAVLFFLKLRKMVTMTLERKLFDIITSSPNVEQKMRAASGVGNGDGSARNTPTVPTVELIEQLGKGNVFWTKKELELMSPETFSVTVETFGNVPDFNQDQLAELRKKAVQVFGPVEHMTESVVTQLGCVSQGFSESELEKLPFLLDNLEEIGRCGWNESQVTSVWKAVANHNGLSAQQLGSVEMAELDRFICGLTSSELRQLDLDHFKDAVDAVGGVSCSRPVTQELRTLAVLAFENPSGWDEAQVSALGNIIAGLDTSQLASLSPSVFPVIRKSCIPLFPPENLASLSVTQLEALGPERAAKVTWEQRAALKDDQQAALMRARAGLRSQTADPSPQSVYSGAPLLSVRGILTFKKPILVLLAGLLLL